MKEVHTTVPAPADLGIGVPQDSDIELDLRFEAVVEGVLVTGAATVQVHGQCARCLDDIDYDETFNLQELFFYPGREVEEDERQVVDETIDLEETLREAVVLELPFTPLCTDDCLGLCPECGFNRNDDLEHGHEQRLDPRWEKLTELGQ